MALKFLCSKASNIKKRTVRVIDINFFFSTLNRYDSSVVDYLKINLELKYLIFDQIKVYIFNKGLSQNDGYLFGK